MIPLSKPFFDEQEIHNIKDVLDSGWVAGQGPKNNELSEYVKSLLNINYAIPVNNCTAALHLSLLALGIETGDEVIVSDYTFPATGHAVMYCGATPRFIDVKSDTYNLNPNLLKDKLTKKTKAIIVVHAFGQMAEMKEIVSFAKKHNLKIIEDAACAMGAQHHGLPTGAYGDVACYSFHARKNATCGEGGMVVTNNSEIAQKVSLFSCFGMESAFAREAQFTIPTFKFLGYNYKLSDINASIILAQLKKFHEMLNKKRKLINIYNDLLSSNELVKTPLELDHNVHIYQSYVVIVNECNNRDNLILSLREDGIQTQIGTYSSHIQPVYNSKDICPTSLLLYKQSLALPLFHEMSEEQVHYVVEKLLYHLSKYFKEK